MAEKGSRHYFAEVIKEKLLENAVETPGRLPSTAIMQGGSSMLVSMFYRFHGSVETWYFISPGIVSIGSVQYAPMANEKLNLNCFLVAF